MSSRVLDLGVQSSFQVQICHYSPFLSLKISEALVRAFWPGAEPAKRASWSTSKCRRYTAVKALQTTILAEPRQADATAAIASSPELKEVCPVFTETMWELGLCIELYETQVSANQLHLPIPLPKFLKLGVCRIFHCQHEAWAEKRGASLSCCNSQTPEHFHLDSAPASLCGVQQHKETPALDILLPTATYLWVHFYLL